MEKENIKKLSRLDGLENPQNKVLGILAAQKIIDKLNEIIDAVNVLKNTAEQK